MDFHMLTIISNSMNKSSVRLYLGYAELHSDLPTLLMKSDDKALLAGVLFHNAITMINTGLQWTA